MGRKMKMKPRPEPPDAAQAGIEEMGTAFMPDMGQGATVPPKIPSPILPPGQGPMKRPSSKVSKRFIKKMQKPLPNAGKSKRQSAGQKIEGKSHPPKKDKMSDTVDKEQKKQIADIIRK